MGKIVVAGSINMDFVYYIRKHPVAGQTVHSYKNEMKPGGKGANQAVAAALAGGDVTLVGAVGRDSYSKEIVPGLERYGVKTDRIVQKAGDIGTAFIAVDEFGQNRIILGEGANGRLSVQDLKFLPELLEESAVLLVQNEIPWSCTRFAIETAKRLGVQSYLNPAPAFEIPDDIFPLVDVMILNESEAEFITKIPLEADLSAVNLAADRLVKLGVCEVIITLGSKGSYYMNNQGETIFTPAFTVNAVDTTAAGDTFIGSFIVFRQTGLPVEECLRRASAASALTVSRAGAQESIPDAGEVALFLDNYPDGSPQYAV